MAEVIIAHNYPRWERLRYFIHLSKKNPLFLIGLGVVVMLVIAAVFAPWITPYPEDAKYSIKFGSKLKPPSMDHFSAPTPWVGTSSPGLSSEPGCPSKSG
jgi:peptide/nickel transport system permease protein